jgi:hypothetical protein
MFGSTKCVKCEGTSFKMQEIELQDAAYKMMVAQCTSCQTPFGVTDYLNTAVLLQNQDKVIADLQQKIDSIQSGVGQIIRAMQLMSR